MNLHQIVRGAITTVNPDVPGVLKVNSGFTTAPGGKRVQSYTDVDVMAQMQELSSTDLKQVDAINVQGILQSVYLNGNFNGINRPDQKGGDILIVDGQEWLTVKVPELWPDWCRVIVNLQRSP
ncbi:hypothetical protein [Enterobacter cloacae]|uniref:hypothetical protein n=1 Tax=Enterobacter cloacae TaxID=550 RepID=UPI0028740234|nr:hypothetical protein [Enterobacter cloacae]MDS0065179.1 hypothetical protein [Enterobacter cloacae subsp. cloacae]MDS0107865.1 hypothetical protein [Enterobacter cloacae subsp. cloacae]MDW8497699.1 hypothetical protein [Enterobacter cloacae subsp. cloacae]HBN6068339.1 hypothetical protein [Enterobacter cloacae]